MEEKPLDLSAIRDEIDKVNKDLLALLIKRLELCHEVADYKKERGLPIYVPEREKAIVDWAEETAGPEFAPYARRFFEQVMALGRDYESGVIDASGSAEMIATRPDAVLTERMILLPLDEGDLRPVQSIVSNTELMDGLYLSVRETEEETLSFIREETAVPNLAFKIILRGNSQYAGLLLLKPDPDSPEKVLVSVVFVRDCWHQGYLTELLPAVEKIAFSRLQAASVWAYVPDEKLYALRAFFKAGYQVASVLSLPERNFQVVFKPVESSYGEK